MTVQPAELNSASVEIKKKRKHSSTNWRTFHDAWHIAGDVAKGACLFSFGKNKVVLP